MGYPGFSSSRGGRRRRSATRRVAAKGPGLPNAKSRIFGLAPSRVKHGRDRVPQPERRSHRRNGAQQPDLMAFARQEPGSEMTSGRLPPAVEAHGQMLAELQLRDRTVLDMP